MREYLKHYHMNIHTLAPVHIGSGVSMTKKEYIYQMWDNIVIIPDMRKLFEAIQKKHLERKYEEYLLSGRKDDLGKWLKAMGFRNEDIQSIEAYRLNAGDSAVVDQSKSYPKMMEIMAFVKDPYGCPFVPGSSIKGMIRTALMCYEIHKHPEGYRRQTEAVAFGAQQRSSRVRCLSKETEELEQEVFHTLEHDVKHKRNAVNCNLSGLIVGDSRPIDVGQLTLCQKIDVKLDGTEKKLPLLRESLKPETDIHFDLTLDETQCPYTVEDIMEALDFYQRMVSEHYNQRFIKEKQDSQIVWLGGGTGFASKTILYPVYGLRAVEIADSVFRNTLGKNYEVHKHTKDRSLRISPHVFKCTRYNGELYSMGKCRMEIET